MARRIPHALAMAIHDDNGRPETHAQEKHIIEHHACGVFLAGAMSYLEGKYGKRSWRKTGKAVKCFEDFVANSKIWSTKRLSSEWCEAMRHLRNAWTHNSGDLSKDKFEPANAIRRVGDGIEDESLPGVALSGTVVTMREPFLECVRLFCVAVSQYHGDG